MLERLEQQRKLTLNQCKIMIAAVLGDMLDFFDYFLIGYVLAFIVHDWNLTYGQSAHRTQRFFGDASYAIIGPYSAEVWPDALRASGMGVGYATGNIGKVVGPLGLAVIVGTSNYVHPQATLDAIVPPLLYLAFWYGQAGVAFWLLGFETRGRSIEEIDRSLTGSAMLAAAGSTRSTWPT